MSIAHFTLLHGETEQRRWTISGTSFLRRSAVQAVVTLILLLPMWWYASLLIYLFAALVLTPLLMWTFGDFSIWRDNRNTVWMLSSHAVHVYGPDAADPIDLRLPLQDIRSISTFALWSLVLRLETGTAITLPLAPQPRALRQHILEARAKLMGSDA